MGNDHTYTAHRIAATSAELPVTIEAARQHLRNEDIRFDDNLVAGLIRSAASAIETGYGLALLEQTVVQYHRAFPCNSDTPMLLRIAPLLSVSKIEYVDAAGVTQTWNSAHYTAGHYNNTAFVVPKVGQSYPSGLWASPNSVVITYEAGYGDSADSVPAQIVQAILLQVGWMYENREDPIGNITRASDNLLRPFYRFAI
jgi:uncharacterized phiE125 gp8 family phage protein